MRIPLEQRRLLPLKDAAAYTGMSRSTLYAQEKLGRLKFTKILGSTRVELAELDRWINETAQVSN
ncbi:helix-turn-helix domain-containing protein [uncultured Sulfitobacter sp.]|uniref:helix-turn-helix transcriptional regulator n=1 Tax=uncultured Sulfitobacter sp. TaxID=191468 RepID=UPI00261120B3|nr:helix-turn-helix domain-containing protein [uncultured Sulfitobacter sp.]